MCQDYQSKFINIASQYVTGRIIGRSATFEAVAVATVHCKPAAILSTGSFQASEDSCAAPATQQPDGLDGGRSPSLRTQLHVSRTTVTSCGSVIVSLSLPPIAARTDFR